MGFKACLWFHLRIGPLKVNAPLLVVLFVLNLQLNRHARTHFFIDHIILALSPSLSSSIILIQPWLKTAELCSTAGKTIHCTTHQEQSRLTVGEGI